MSAKKNTRGANTSKATATQTYHKAKPITVYGNDAKKSVDQIVDNNTDSKSTINPFKADLSESTATSLADKLVNYAGKFIGTRYRSGGKGPSAFDCSGFMGWVYEKFGMKLNSSSRSQYTQGDKIDLDKVKPGDLLFFSTTRSGRGNVGHVAMVVSVNKNAGTCEFIHASTSKGVTYQRFPDNGYFSKHFIGARRVLGTNVSDNAFTL